jgi:1,4-alpha-glucan branching enzyme
VDPEQVRRRENLDAVEFLRDHEHRLWQHPGIVTIAEESTAWPQVSPRSYEGGFGFGYKWNMGWMHDTLSYMQKRPDLPHYTTTS